MSFQNAFPGVIIRNTEKGKSLFAIKSFVKGDAILEEDPLFSCQFAWNKEYKYLACDYCMRPLETAVQNARRLSGKPQITLPHPECCGWSPSNIERCPRCDTIYCSVACRDIAFQMYHQTLCYDKANSYHPLEVLMNAWRNIHYPPETTNILLLVRILATIKQSPTPEVVSNCLKTFTSRTISDDSLLVHKLLGDQFVEQLEMLRQMTAQVISGPFIDDFLTPDGFRSMIALIGTNGQGIGTSAMAHWANNITKLDVPFGERAPLDELVENVYDMMENESGSFIDNNGSGLYQMQSSCNHSCVPNAESAFPYNNHRLQLKAVRDINPEDEIVISYLDECMLSRSRRTRQEELALNYLFRCSCERCSNPESDSCSSVDGDEEDMTD